MLFLFQVDALAMYRVIDIACGSGDAQTLCITDDENVWSWGDGDYGKLGIHRTQHHGDIGPISLVLTAFFIGRERRFGRLQAAYAYRLPKGLASG